MTDPAGAGRPDSPTPAEPEETSSERAEPVVPSADGSAAATADVEPATEPAQPDAAGPDAARSGAGTPAAVQLGTEAEEATTDGAATDEPARRSPLRVSSTGVLIALLLAVLGFTVVVQVRHNSTDSAFSTLREEDLLRLLFDINARDDRLQQDITSLQATRKQLADAGTSREQLLEAAKARADDLGILAGTLPAQGRGVTVRLQAGSQPIGASLLVNAVYELRGAGAEAMQIEGQGGAVRIIASTSFVDSEGGVLIDGRTLRAPFVITAIGEPKTLNDAMYIPTGVVDEVRDDDGNVIVSQLDEVLVSQTRSAPDLEYAQPVG
jgi:uncharacterized protein YlxW (UPF0749 family)